MEREPIEDESNEDESEYTQFLRGEAAASVSESGETLPQGDYTLEECIQTAAEVFRQRELPCIPDSTSYAMIDCG